ncbi:NAD(P)H:quinone oxidoreductase [Haloglycomyces albus]|uniref:NAD(P)H:quinone oxidoreductase n=1 Tax=Haloglycomyces albus TaxID=526067 RepID=UPI00046D796E|nr:NAD(P)H:quinone oxidoreductase [Haloglycomyces albus]
MVNLAIIYYSQTGNVHAMAKTAEREANDWGAEVRLRRAEELAPASAIESNADWKAHFDATLDIPVATLDDLEWADALMFGTPTRYGLPTAQLKQFIDQTGPLWGAGKLINKTVSAFTSSQTSHGGQETTITSMMNTFYHWGAIIVPLGYTDPMMFEAELGNPYGASHVGVNGPVGEKTRIEVALLTKRLLGITDSFKKGSTT